MGYNVTKIQEHFWAIDDMFVRCFLLEGTDRALLIDTVLESGDLLSQCKELTDKPIFVINTHSDIDHIGSNRQFEEIYMHPSEFEYYSQNNKGKPFPKPIWEGEIVGLGNFKLEVILVPGHTQGCIALLEREKRFLIAGDSVTQVPLYLFGPGRSLPAFIASMEKLEKLKSEIDIVYSSHFGMAISPDIISELKDCGKGVLAGEITGVTPDERFVPEKGVLHYQLGRVGIVYYE